MGKKNNPNLIRVYKTIYNPKLGKTYPHSYLVNPNKFIKIRNDRVNLRRQKSLFGNKNKNQNEKFNYIYTLEDFNPQIYRKYSKKLVEDINIILDDPKLIQHPTAFYNYSGGYSNMFKINVPLIQDTEENVLNMIKSNVYNYIVNSHDFLPSIFSGNEIDEDELIKNVDEFVKKFIEPVLDLDRKGKDITRLIRTPKYLNGIKKFVEDKFNGDDYIFYILNEKFFSPLLMVNSFKVIKPDKFERVWRGISVREFSKFVKHIIPDIEEKLASKGIHTDDLGDYIEYTLGNYSVYDERDKRILYQRLKKITETINEAISKGEVERHFIDFFDIDEIYDIDGVEFTYRSTSKNKKVALNFSIINNDFISFPIIIEFRNIDGYYIKPFSQHPEEDEILMRIHENDEYKLNSVELTYMKKERGNEYVYLPTIKMIIEKQN